MEGEKKQIVSIKHQEEKTMHHFEVVDSKKLTPSEVKHICKEMGVAALFVEGKYYSRN